MTEAPASIGPYTWDDFIALDVLADDAVFCPEAFPEMTIPLGGLWHLAEGD